MPPSCASSIPANRSSITSGRRAKILTSRRKQAIVKAFTSLKPGKDDNILAILRGKKFVAANNAEYDEIRAAAKQLELF